MRETGGGGSEAERALIEAPRGYSTREEEVYDLAVTVPSCPSEPWREGPATAKATVKWFNHAKGYGFVVPEDGATDVFLHVSILERAGIANLFEGTVIDCSIVDGERGPQVAAIRALFLPAGLPAPVGDAVEGTVKWFNTAKRYGFIVPDDGGKDIFFHASAMQRSGIHELAEGQRVRVTTTVGEKGPQAELIDIL